MGIRRIYRWDDPTETAKFLAAYVILWLMSYMTGAAVGSIWQAEGQAHWS